MLKPSSMDLGSWIGSVENERSLQRGNRIKGPEWGRSLAYWETKVWYYRNMRCKRGSLSQVLEAVVKILKCILRTVEVLSRGVAW